MKDTLYIRIAPHGAGASWCVHTPQGGFGPIFQGTLEECIRHGVARRIVLFVPTADTTLTTAELPERIATSPDAKIQRAIPFILEERLAEDVETLHFAIGRRQAGGKFAVAIANRARMDEWLAPFRAAGFSPALVVPELLAIPHRDSSQPVWSVLLEETRAQVRTANQSGFVCEPEMLADFVSLAEKPEGLHLQLYPAVDDARRAATVAALGTAGLPCEAARTVRDPLEYLLRGFDEAQAINLLQGEYATRSDYQILLQPWRAALVLLAVWLALSLTAQGLELFRLKREITALEATAHTAFRAAFPQVAQITDLRTQAQQQLAVLERGGGNVGFLPLLQTTANVLGRNPKLKLQEIQYRDGALQLAVDAADVEALDAFKRAFGEQAGFLLEVQSANVADKGVQIRATLKAAKS